MSPSASPLTIPAVDEIRSLHALGYRRARISELTGLPIRTVSEVLAGKRAGRPLSPREQAAADRLAGWSPDCMTAPEWEHWRDLNPLSGLTDGAMAARPCDDCPLGYAADMRAQGRCNGNPGGVAAEADDEEVALMDPVQPQTRAEAGRRVPVAIEAPCPRCIKADVCPILERDVPRLAELPVMVAPFDRRLSLVLSGDLTCSAFVRAPKAAAAKAGPKATRGVPAAAAELTARQAEILDAVVAAGGDKNVAAEALGCLTQQVDSTLLAIAAKGRIPADLLDALPDRFRLRQAAVA